MSQGQELQNLDSTRSQSYAGPYSGISGSRHRVRDEQTLARLGKKQVLKVRFCDTTQPSSGKASGLTSLRTATFWFPFPHWIQLHHPCDLGDRFGVSPRRSRCRANS